MKHKFFAVLFLLLFTLSIGASHRDRIKKKFSMDQNGKLTISNINGAITLSTHGKSEIYLNAVKTARSESDLENVILKFEFEKNELRVTAKRLNRKSSVRIDITVKVPENLSSLNLMIANGPVEMSGRLGEIKARSTNGDIRFRGISSNTRFDTVNGGIFLIFKENLRGNISAGTINGTVQIELPEDSSFRIDGFSMNGGIKSDFRVKVDSQFIGSKVHGTINRGQYRINLKTTNGNIKILKV